MMEPLLRVARRFRAMFRRGLPILLTLVAACGVRTPPPAAVPMPEANLSEKETVAYALSRNREILTLRARLRIRATVGATETETDGILIARRPSDFRLRVLAPFGITLADVLAVNGRIYRDQRFGREIPAMASLSELNLAHALLGTLETAPPRCTFHGRRADCPLDAAASIGIDLDHAVTVEMNHPQHGKVELSGHQLVDGFAVPFDVTLVHWNGSRLHIRVTEYELNPKLDPSLFAPPPEQRP